MSYIHTHKHTHSVSLLFADSNVNLKKQEEREAKHNLNIPPNTHKAAIIYQTPLSLQDIHSHVSIKDKRLKLAGWKPDPETTGASLRVAVTDADQTSAYKGPRG